MQLFAFMRCTSSDYGAGAGLNVTCTRVFSRILSCFSVSDLQRSILLFTQLLAVVSTQKVERIGGHVHGI